MPARRQNKNTRRSKVQHKNESHGATDNAAPQSSGRIRVADLDFMFRQFQSLEQHSDQGCGVFHFEVTHYNTEGEKGWEMVCRKCHFKKLILAEENQDRNPADSGED